MNRYYNYCSHLRFSSYINIPFTFTSAFIQSATALTTATPQVWTNFNCSLLRATIKTQESKRMPLVHGRALHYVFKIPERKDTGRFYRDILGMKILRHEEFSEGCNAACNGPYANRWSKTMIGYGPEDTHFVIELTFNYPKDYYEKGNDFVSITIRSKEALDRARKANWPIEDDNTLVAPGGYKFTIIDHPQPIDKDPIEKVTLASSNLQRSIEYWNGIIGLNIYNKSDNTVTLGFTEDQVKLELKHIDKPINRAEAYGRIAFSCPHTEQEVLDETIRKHNEKVLTPLITLDTPGKASVRVIILADPDGHEICFVDDENFRLLSKVDSDAEKLFDRYANKEKEARASLKE